MAIKIGSTTRIDNNGAATFTTITGTSISVSGDSNADRFKINGTSVISSSRAITATSITMSSTFQINNLNPRIELVGSGGTPYIDFRTGKTGSDGDHDMRIIVEANDHMRIHGRYSTGTVEVDYLQIGAGSVTHGAVCTAGEYGKIVRCNATSNRSRVCVCIEYVSDNDWKWMAIT